MCSFAYLFVCVFLVFRLIQNRRTDLYNKIFVKDLDHILDTES